MQRHLKILLLTNEGTDLKKFLFKPETMYIPSDHNYNNELSGKPKTKLALSINPSSMEAANLLLPMYLLNHSNKFSGLTQLPFL
jgi:hypothetical protein